MNKVKDTVVTSGGFVKSVEIEEKLSITYVGNENPHVLMQRISDGNDNPIVIKPEMIREMTMVVTEKTVLKRGE